MKSFETRRAERVVEGRGGEMASEPRACEGEEAFIRSVKNEDARKKEKGRRKESKKVRKKEKLTLAILSPRNFNRTISTFLGV